MGQKPREIAYVEDERQAVLIENVHLLPVLEVALDDELKRRRVTWGGAVRSAVHRRPPVRIFELRPQIDPCK